MRVGGHGGRIAFAIGLGGVLVAAPSGAATPKPAASSSTSYELSDAWGKLKAPNGIAISRGHVFLGDRGRDQVIELTRSGRELNSFGGRKPQRGPVRDPTDVAVADNGRIFVASERRKVRGVYVFNRRGRLLRSWRVPPRPLSLALDPVSGHVFVFFYTIGNVRLREYTRSGRLFRTQSAAGRFEFPLGATFGPDGRLFIAGYGQLAVLDRELRPVEDPNEIMPWKTGDAYSVALDRRGRVYLGGERQIRVFGRHLRELGQIKRAPDGPLGSRRLVSSLALDRRNRIYVADFRRTKVQVLSPAGGS